MVRRAAIARDPLYGPALAYAAVCCYRLCLEGSEHRPRGDSRKGASFARQALQLRDQGMTLKKM